jgi:hypothetical protein
VVGSARGRRRRGGWSCSGGRQLESTHRGVAARAAGLNALEGRTGREKLNAREERKESPI